MKPQRVKPPSMGLFAHDGTTRRVCLQKETADVVIARPSKWGNPWMVYRDGGLWVVRRKGSAIEYRSMDRAKAIDYAIERYAEWLPMQERLMSALPELKGKRLGCFCGPSEPCHGDVLVRLVEGL